MKKMNRVFGVVALVSGLSMATGCGAQVDSGAFSVTKMVKAGQAATLTQTTGAVEVAFPGLKAAYQTLATTNDIDTVRITLVGAGSDIMFPLDDAVSADDGAIVRPDPMPTIRPEPKPSALPIPAPKPQPIYRKTIELTRKDLVKNKVKATFDKVPPGAVVMMVEALDRAKKVIGSGRTASSVKAGKTTDMKLDVRLQPSSTGTGSVAAEVTFIESDVVRPMAE